MAISNVVVNVKWIVRRNALSASSTDLTTSLPLSLMLLTKLLMPLKRSFGFFFELK